MKIRKYKDEDKTGLINFWEIIFPDDPPHNEPASVIDAKLAIDDLIFLAEENGQIIGACMAGYDGHRGWLYAVGVSIERRRSGTGSALIKHVMQELKRIGCIKVNLQIRSSNVQVAKFYESLGFASEDRLSMGLKL